MRTECSAEFDLFGAVEGRRLAVDFDGGAITSDAGGLLLGAMDRAVGLIDRFAACFEGAGNSSSAARARSLGSGCSASHSAMKTSTTMTSFVTTR
jgi:hypothetical protein